MAIDQDSHKPKQGDQHEHAVYQDSAQIIKFDEINIKDHLVELVRGTVEETPNTMLDAEADQICNSARYKRSEARKDTRAGYIMKEASTPKQER